jgi:hypothetical protein
VWKGPPSFFSRNYVIERSWGISSIFYSIEVHTINGINKEQVVNCVYNEDA